MRRAARTGRLINAVTELGDLNGTESAVENRLRIAGHEVLIRYTDSVLAEALTRATRHLDIHGTGDPDLIIGCFSEPGMERRVPADWPAHGTTYGDDGTTVFSWDGPEGPLFVYDRDRRHGLAVFRSSDAVSPWEQTAPFRRILHWWGADRGLRLVHAAAVGHASGGLLLVGRSGSGKSTTALACLEAGLGFAGDDYCLLSPGDPPWVNSLYLSAKGDAHAAALLGGLREAFAASPLKTWGKSVLFVDEVRAQGIRHGFPLHGIVVARRTGDSLSSLSRLSPAAALRAVAPSTLLQTPGDRAGDLAGLAAIVRQLPAWELTLGSPADAVARIKELLADGGTT